MPSLFYNIRVAQILVWCMVLLLSACSSQSDKYYAQVVDYYMPAGWLKYQKIDKDNNDKEYSGYLLIQQAQLIDQAIIEVLNFHGKPDFVRAAAKNKLNLAYLKKGTVLSFTLNSGFTPNVYPYSKFNNLSQHLVKHFKKNNEVD
jgi:hypothetical protein